MLTAHGTRTIALCPLHHPKIGAMIDDTYGNLPVLLAQPTEDQMFRMWHQTLGQLKNGCPFRTFWIYVTRRSWLEDEYVPLTIVISTVCEFVADTVYDDLCKIDRGFVVMTAVRNKCRFGPRFKESCMGVLGLGLTQNLIGKMQFVPAKQT